MKTRHPKSGFSYAIVMSFPAEKGVAAPGKVKLHCDAGFPIHYPTMHEAEHRIEGIRSDYSMLQVGGIRRADVPSSTSVVRVGSVRYVRAHKATFLGGSTAMIQANQFVTI
jgi:hypothetical protein